MSPERERIIGDVATVVLREPAELYGLAMSRSAHDPLITLADIEEKP